MGEISTTCPYCGVGCGVVAQLDGVEDSSRPYLAGAVAHPANFGRLCSKGSGLADTLDHRNRLVDPIIDDQAVSWDAATAEIARRLNHCIAKHGPQSVAFYLSGQLLTEDYYVANKFMKGFVGSANVDTNSRLCMASAVAAHKRAFGSDSVPGCYEDLEIADLLVLIGSNAAWTHPVIYQRIVAAKEKDPNKRVVVIDPRSTPTSQIADLVLNLRPGTDGFLFNGLIKFLIENDRVDKHYIDAHTVGFEDLEVAATKMDLKSVSADTGIAISDLLKFYQWFADTEKTVSLFSQGINQSASGTDKCNAIINVHLATGRIGKPGASPFSLTGQPNAMGGREVGGLANQLAAHMGFDKASCELVQRFWASPKIAQRDGLKAVELFDAMHQGEIKFIWIMATNPAVSLPNTSMVREALARCPTVVVSDVVKTDTVDLANVVLPAQAWAEKDGTVTNSERRISRQRRFRSPPAGVKADWMAVQAVAQKMGFETEFAYQSSAEIFREHAALSGFENDTDRGFNIELLAQLSDSQYDELEPVSWPITSTAPTGTQRRFSDGLFDTPSRRASFIKIDPVPAVASVASVRSNELVLNTGRVRDQWHTMGRTGQVPALNLHRPTPFLQLNPKDARKLDIADRQLVEVRNELGSFLCLADITEDVLPGNPFAPMHWSDQNSVAGLVNSLFPPITDPHSGQPELKAAAVRVVRKEFFQFAVIVCQRQIDTSCFDYWSMAKIDHGWIYLAAIDNENFDWLAWGKEQTAFDIKIRRLQMQSGKDQRMLLSNDQGRLGIFTHSEVGKLPSVAWLNSKLNSSKAWSNDVLLGEENGQDSTICSCFATSRKSIENLLTTNPEITLQGVSELIGCGSKCGSCRPEIQLLIEMAEPEQKSVLECA